MHQGGGNEQMGLYHQEDYHQDQASWSSLLLSPCHHDHYDDHDHHYEARLYYVEGGALSVFVRSWRGWRNSRSHPTKKNRIYTEYTQKILWRTIGNRQNRMLRIIGYHYRHYHRNHNNHSLWECEQAKHRDIWCESLRVWTSKTQRYIAGMEVWTLATNQKTQNVQNIHDIQNVQNIQNIQNVQDSGPKNTFFDWRRRGAARLESASGDRLCEESLKRPGRFTKTIVGYHKLWHLFFGFSSF